MKIRSLFCSLILFGLFLTAAANPAPVIVIDPGHGGKDPGAISRSRVREKDLVLAIGKKLMTSLKKRGAQVYLTRNRDQFLTLEHRDQVANQRSCDLFLSLHANAAKRRKANGLELYYLNKATDAASRRLAARENEGSAKPKAAVEAILSDLIQTAATEESATLAQIVKKTVTSRMRGRGLKEVRVKSALFYVLVGAKCPSLLIETGFMTHPEEGRRLKSAAYQTQLAEAIAEGAVRYLREAAESGGDL